MTALLAERYDGPTFFSLPPLAWPAPTSVLTLVGGEIVWDAGVL